MEHSRRSLLLLLASLATGCRNGGDISIFGYSTTPQFDPNIRSVYIPIFKNSAFHTTPYRGMEVRLTEAIVQEINARRSPLRVVSDPAKADTELIGSITQILKVPLNRTLQNLNREFDVIIIAEVVWRDLRTGKSLTGSRQENPPLPTPPFDPTLPQPAPAPPPIISPPIVLQSNGRAIPELGESNATAEDMAIQRLARQIVDMMEAPW